METTEGEDRIDRTVNWVRSKIGFERLEPRIIYTLEHKDAHKDEQKESAHGEPVATEQPVSEQSVDAQDEQKARKYPPQKNLLSRRCPSRLLPRIWLMRPPNPSPGSATEPSDAVAVSGADDPTGGVHPHPRRCRRP